MCPSPSNWAIDSSVMMIFLPRTCRLHSSHHVQLASKTLSLKPHRLAREVEQRSFPNPGTPVPSSNPSRSVGCCENLLCTPSKPAECRLGSCNECELHDV